MALNSIPVRRNTRAVVLLVSLMLIGGTGCITMSLIDRAQRASDDRASARKAEKERQQRLAELGPQAAAGDVRAMTRVAVDLLNDDSFSGPDWQRALALLEQASARGDGLARAVLGEMLLEGKWSSSRIGDRKLPGGAQPERGLHLMKLAAGEACTYSTDSVKPYIWRKPAEGVFRYYESRKNAAQTTLWQARNILHCHNQLGFNSWSAQKGEGTEAERELMLALELLGNDPRPVRAIKNTLGLNAIARAEASAAELRRLVAASEQQYPAPPQERRK